MHRQSPVELKASSASKVVGWKIARSKARVVFGVAFIVAMLGVAHLPLVAQSTFGGIVGTVQDNSGAAVTGAEVSVRLVDDNSVRVATSDQAGTYQVLNLKPGRYEVTVVKETFATTRVQEIDLTAREERRVNVRLGLATVQEQVTVSSEAASINTENGTIADSKSFAQVSALPLTTQQTGANLGRLERFQNIGARPSRAFYFVPAAN